MATNGSISIYCDFDLDVIGFTYVCTAQIVFIVHTQQLKVHLCAHFNENGGIER